MRTLNRIYSTSIIAALLVLITGCAIATRPVLIYSPVTPVKPRNNMAIQVKRFHDNRLNKSVIGHMRSGFGFKTFEVVTQTNVAEWATSALTSELSNAGYDVVAKDSSSELAGEIFGAYCDAYLSYEGLAEIKVSLKKDNKIILDKTYAGRAQEINWAATGEGYASTLKSALQNAISQVVADVNRTLSPGHT